jgi:hypothetical protein
LNQSISDKEKESGLYRLEDAQAYMQGIWEEIEKYAMKLAGKDKLISGLRVWQNSSWTSEQVCELASWTGLQTPVCQCHQISWGLQTSSREFANSFKLFMWALCATDIET